MNEMVYFLTQVRRTKGSYDKGVVVKDSYDAVCQSFHAYLGAYAFGNHKESGEVITDYVFVAIHDSNGNELDHKKWEMVAAQA